MLPELLDTHNVIENETQPCTFRYDQIDKSRFFRACDDSSFGNINIFEPPCWYIKWDSLQLGSFGPYQYINSSNCNTTTARCHLHHVVDEVAFFRLLFWIYTFEANTVACSLHPFRFQLQDLGRRSIGIAQLLFARPRCGSTWSIEYTRSAPRNSAEYAARRPTGPAP